MKLVEDDGDVICDLDDDVGVLMISIDMDTHIVIPQAEDDAYVPQSHRLLAALMLFLQDRDNVEAVLKLIPDKGKCN